MDEPPFALVCGWRYPLLIIAKGGSFSTVSTLRLFSSTSLACGFLYENKSEALQKAPLLLSKKVLPFRDRKNILILNDKYILVYNAYSGQTETMQAKWANLKKMEEETFAKIIIGKADISEFDTFVENWKNQGGDQILKEINEELNNSSGN